VCFTGAFADLRHAFRLLWKSKGITATTIVMLALCIGATTTIFSTVYSLMLKPLPYQQPERVVELYTSAVKAGLDHMPANVPFYLDYSKNATSYESIGLWTFFYGLVGENDSVVRVPGVRMTAEIFDILRVQPVIGVAPRVFEAFDARMKFVVPLSWPPAAENPQGRYGVGIQLFGRLKSGVAVGQADAEAKTLEKRYVDAGPPPLKDFVERSGMTMNVGGVQEQRVRPVRPTLLMLQGGVVFVLLIGCVNVANLLLVRSNALQSELAIRSALGVGRGTIARQLLPQLHSSFERGYRTRGEERGDGANRADAGSIGPAMKRPTRFANACSMRCKRFRESHPRRFHFLHRSREDCRSTHSLWRTIRCRPVRRSRAPFE
jgi:hypothetical protein